MSGAAGPLISVIIPTRERCETLRFAIQSALKQTCGSYEIVVSDNSSRDKTQEVVSSFDDPRIRYFRTAKHVSMCDSYEFGLTNSRGEYVVFIGDDDAVLPGGIDRLEGVIRRRPSEAYIWPASIYTWPTRGEQPHFSQYSIQPSAVLNLKKMARQVITHGGWGYFEIPGVYHAATSRRILDSIVAMTGRVFHSTQPDIFSSMAVPVFSPYGFRIGIPITMLGVSEKSVGHTFFMEEADETVAKILCQGESYEIHRTLVPEAKATINLVADAFLVAMEKFPQFYGKMRFNYNAMWAFMCRWRQVKLGSLLKNYRGISRYHPFSATAVCTYAAYHVAEALWNKMRRRASGNRYLPTSFPENVCDFAAAFGDWLEKASGRNSA